MSLENKKGKMLFSGSLPGNSSLFSGRLPGNSGLFSRRNLGNSGLFSRRGERGEDEGGFSMGLGVTIEKNEARAQRREGRRPVRLPAPLWAYPCACATLLPHVHKFPGSRLSAVIACDH